MVVGTWNSKTGKWFKCCPVCNSNFEGRKNQKYCGSICKNHHNNHPELAPVVECKTCNDTGVTRDNNRRPIYCMDCKKAIQIAGTGNLN